MRAGNWPRRSNTIAMRRRPQCSRCRVAGGGPDGYEVAYEYGGREYVTRLDHDPGPTLRLGRDVREDGRPFDNVAYNEPYRR